MAPNKNYTAVLQFDSRQISFVRAQIQGERIEIAASARLEGNWPAEEGSLGAALKRFIEEHGLEKDEICVIVPRHEATARLLTLPSEDPAEIASMVTLSAEEFVPYSTSELTIDQCIVDSAGNGESHVLAVLVHQDVVNKYLDLLSAAGVTPTRLLFSTACLASACAAAKPSGAEDRYCVSHISSSSMEVVVMEGQKLRYTRGVATHHDWNGNSADEAREELAMEVRGSLSAYRRESEDGLGADQVFFSSEGLELESLTELVVHEVGKDCFVADNGARIVDEGAEHLPAPMLTALGALLSAAGRAKWTINLLPQRLSRIQDLNVLKDRIRRVAAVAALILVAGAILYAQAVHQRSAYLSELEQQAALLRPSASDVSSKQQQMRIVAQQVSRDGSVLELLSTLVEAAPESDLNITRFVYSREGGISLWGRALTKDHVFRFLDRIRELGADHLDLLRRARSVYEQEGQERNKPVFNYQIEIPFEEESDGDVFTPTSE